MSKGPELILAVARLKRLHFRRQIQDLNTFLSCKFDEVRKPGVASDAAIRGKSNRDEPPSSAFYETVQTNEEIDADIFAIVVDFLDERKISPPCRADPFEQGIGETTVTQSTTQEAVRARRGSLWDGDISQSQRTLCILEIGLPSFAVWIVGVFGSIDIIGNERQDHDVRIVCVQKKFGPKKGLIDSVSANAGVEDALLQHFLQMRRPRLTIVHLVSEGE